MLKSVNLSVINSGNMFGDKHNGDRRVQAGPIIQNRFETHHENTRSDQLINIVHLTAEQTA